MSYYCARLHIVCIVDDPDHDRENGHTCDYPFVLFQAADAGTAFTRALELGRAKEHSYLNCNERTVRWALRAVEQIWYLGNELDGVEAGSILDVYRLETPLGIDAQFTPENELPVFT